MRTKLAWTSSTRPPSRYISPNSTIGEGKVVVVDVHVAEDLFHGCLHVSLGSTACWHGANGLHLQAVGTSTFGNSRANNVFLQALEAKYENAAREAAAIKEEHSQLVGKFSAIKGRIESDYFAEVCI